MKDTRFPFEGPRDFLSKARRELHQLLDEVEPADGDPDPARIADLTMNVAWTLWQVLDWIAKSDDPMVQQVVPAAAREKSKPKRLDALQDQVRADSVDLTYCWELANLFKHFELDDGQISTPR